MVLNLVTTDTKSFELSVVRTCIETDYLKKNKVSLLSTRERLLQWAPFFDGRNKQQDKYVQRNKLAW